MRIYKGGTVVFDYRKDGSCRVYRERWYHKIRTAFFTLLWRLGWWG